MKMFTMQQFATRLLISSLAISVAACSPAVQSPTVEAEVEPLGEGQYKVAWSSDSGPVSIFIATSPDAVQHRIANGNAVGEVVTRAKIGDRPYFFVKPAKGMGRWVAERVLPLEGGRNFRDMGGYQTANGAVVKWGKIYRSGSMHDLTPSDYKYLDQIGVRVVCDLRTRGERENEPNKWAEAAAINYWARDYTMSEGDLSIGALSKMSNAQMKAHMIKSYQSFPDEQAPAYREIFRKVANGDLPLAFNCSLGKDRAGVAAALILSALGVPDETIIRDYVASQDVIDYKKILPPPTPSPAGTNLSVETLKPILGTDPEYIIASLTSIRAHYGTIENYITQKLGISKQDITKIKENLLDS